jgi:dTDP-4-amino-4,6-dideoxygalactose transaminase
VTPICERFGVPIIEDSAEALGATYAGEYAGSFGEISAFSFNGNKIVTTGGGGMLVARQKASADRARFLAAQARDPAPHYQHSAIGYNYRLSNLAAALGRAQLRSLHVRVARRQAIFERYKRELGRLPGWSFQPEEPRGKSTRWLTCVQIDPRQFGASREDVRNHLETLDIEARPVWKPMHLQPIFASHERVGGAVAEALFEYGLCLPSGSGLTDEEQGRVIAGVLSVPRGASTSN